ncbi:acyltransferase [Burkholderia sp. JP2-270]|uniref:acyltransferase family protein n=1 Tax=Burkholderia sp. JP2-270 TaxID=2217913 RepID=UPI000DA3833B|nr:acyltransferase [Burkholderia sp. JP2-270]AWV05060.1 acyltransferase [Burkholderia sp. JP2-270]
MNRAVGHAADNRYEILDGLRGVAAISVMLYHFAQDTYSYHVLANAPFCVDLFFMLSAFVLCHSYKDKLAHGLTTTGYIARRVIRLYPMFLISMAIGIPTFGALTAMGLSGYSWNNFLSASIGNLLLVPYLGHPHIADMASATSSLPHENTVEAIFPTNAPAWSLFFEMVASVSLLLLFTLARRALKHTVLLSAAFLILVSELSGLDQGHLVLFAPQGWGTQNFIGGFIRVLFGFSTGVAIYQLHKNNETWKYKIQIGKLIKNDFMLYGVMLLLIAIPITAKGSIPMLATFIVAPLLVCRGAELQATNPASLKLAKLLGWLSYPIYCLHFPIGRLVFFLLPDSEHHPYLATGIATVATILAAALATKFVEEPVRRLLTRKFISGSERPVQPAIRLPADAIERSASIVGARD